MKSRPEENWSLTGWLPVIDFSQSLRDFPGLGHCRLHPAVVNSPQVETFVYWLRLCIHLFLRYLIKHFPLYLSHWFFNSSVNKSLLECCCSKCRWGGGWEGVQSSLRNSGSVGLGCSQNSTFVIAPWKTLTQVLKRHNNSSHLSERCDTCEWKERSPNAVMPQLSRIFTAVVLLECLEYWNVSTLLAFSSSILSCLSTHHQSSEPVLEKRWCPHVPSRISSPGNVSEMWDSSLP